MKTLTIGDLIKYQINKKGIELEKLTEGLCSTTSLKRLINGDTRQNFFFGGKDTGKTWYICK